MRCWMKSLISSISLSFVLCAEADLEDFSRQVHAQSLEGNYSLYQNLPLISHEVYLSFSREQKQEFQPAFVLIDQKLADVKFQNYEATKAWTEEGVGLQFYIKYTHDLWDLQETQEMAHMICVLPDYNQCLLLGEQYNYDAW